ncbi:MAG TPA: hypothetical protein VFE62_13990 [Gemmataceae bacterium]|nr:hypothetical protein [Gemmataceae bacterium]
MSKPEDFVEFEVELDKSHIEFLDKEAARLGCTRNDVMCRAVDVYLNRMGKLFKEREERKKAKGEASRTGHTATKPPTED